MQNYNIVVTIFYTSQKDTTDMNYFSDGFNKFQNSSHCCLRVSCILFTFEKKKKQYLFKTFD